MFELVVRVRLLWVDYLGMLKSRGLVFRIDWSMGQGLLEYSSFSGFYSDYLSEFRFYEVLGILKVYWFRSCKKGEIPVRSTWDHFRV